MIPTPTASVTTFSVTSPIDISDIVIPRRRVSETRLRTSDALA